MTPDRRRVLRIAAAASLALSLPAASSAAPLIRWRGFALGADVSLAIRDADRHRASSAVDACVTELRRIEQVFSLFREDSALVRLNRTGALDDPPEDLVRVLKYAAAVSQASEGAFDVTVQPLWPIYVAAQRDDSNFAAALEQARAKIDWRRLTIAPNRVAFAAPGMAATLNGIAQGHAADRIASLLGARGFTHVLVNMGEIRACGERAPLEPWRVGIGRPGSDALAAVLTLTDRAVATSSPLGTVFDAAGTRHHLFDPHSGRSARSWASVSVVADLAIRADALSTAIAVAAPDAAGAILTAGGGEEALLIDWRGRLVRLRG